MVSVKLFIHCGTFSGVPDWSGFRKSLQLYLIYVWLIYSSLYFWTFSHTSSSPHPTEHALLNTPLSYPGAPPPVSFYPWHHDEDGGRRAEWLTRWDEWDEAYSSSSGTQRDLSQGLRGLQKAEDFLSKTFGTGHYNLHSCCCRNICTQMYATTVFQYILVYIKQVHFRKEL